MKPLLREARRDEAVLQALLQIHDVLEGKTIPGSGWDWGLVVMLAFMSAWLLPVAAMGSCGLLTCLLMPLAKCLDGLVGCCRRRRAARSA
eukprot:CAMPEP_0168504106 /NCGR_PEP_ID=MMETSP0228-20121227/76199_1 /TAXON_ID=133427 /ORGANISM="Protoceratium reticulatum, Strain CCCM 535 (=CCMP 1889)" /LENGTH=89 /DNA_ID=CAMNT_0008521181 /DNA_START=30 /DNA_END=296 /DNA_ORIENTATION=-